MRPLLPGQLPPLDDGIENATPGGQGFRLGPHGLHFKEPIKVTFPYEAARAEGREDVRFGTFFFDELEHRWRPIRQLAVAKESNTVVSATEHFTDFVNATIAMPEHPQPDLFTGTMFKDMKSGDPAAGVTMIQPPNANSSGTANLSYPLVLPPGRRGVQPSLSVSYGNETKSTWLGVGWDLELPHVEIDTRFTGVPRYDGTETYLLDGAPLVKAGPTNDGGVLFRRRAEGPFERIVRYGTKPSDFVFVITAKNGTKYTYGETPDPAHPEEGSRLASPDGNIFRWYLDRVADPFGNRMSYAYFTDVGNNGDSFVQVYPKRIDYTAHDAFDNTALPGD